MHNRYVEQEIMKNCRDCMDEKDVRLWEKLHERNVEPNYASWFWLIEKVKNGPVSDMICLIPKIRHADLFEDIFWPEHVCTEFQQDYLSIFKLTVKHQPVKPFLLKWREPDFLRNAIQDKNVEMVKFIWPKIEARQFSTETFYTDYNYITGTMRQTYVEMVEDLHKMAKESGNKEILELILGSNQALMILRNWNGKMVLKTPNSNLM